MESSSAVNQAFQSTRLSVPSAVASLMWQVNRSGISGASLPPFWASLRKPPILEALLRLVTCTRTPFSCPACGARLLVGGTEEEEGRTE